MITGPQPIDQYEVGDRIEAIYDEESWMTANIIAVTSEYKYSVQFRNGKVIFFFLIFLYNSNSHPRISLLFRLS